MPTKTDAPAGSSTANNEASNLSSGGNPTQKSQEQLLAEFRAENERKQGVIEDLKGKQEEMLSRMNELQELIESGQATRQQEQQFNQLNNQQGNIELQLAQLENDPKNQLGYLSIDRRIERAVKTAEARGEHQALYRLQVGLIEDTAEELGIDEDKFTDELKPIAARFQFDANGQPINVYRKAQLAIREWKKLDAKKKADAEAKKKEAEANGTMETGTGNNDRRQSSSGSKTRLVPGTQEMTDELKRLGL